MLVLSRRRGEKVVFPGLGITVEVVKVAGNRVQLGISAPPEVPVHREEIAKAALEFPAAAPVVSVTAPASC
jgi:carbon storage regulator